MCFLLYKSFNYRCTPTYMGIPFWVTAPVSRMCASPFQLLLPPPYPLLARGCAQCKCVQVWICLYFSLVHNFTHEPYHTSKILLRSQSVDSAQNQCRCSEALRFSFLFWNTRFEEISLKYITLGVT